MSFTIKDKTLFISHTEHSGLRYQNITKTKEKVAHPINSGERKKILSLHHGKFNVRVFGKLHAAIQYIISFYNSKSRK